MTFVLVALARPASELAASIAQLVAVTLRKNFRKIDPAKSRIVLLDGGARVFQHLPNRCREKRPSG